MKTKVRLYLTLLTTLCLLSACSKGLVDEPKEKDNTHLSGDTCSIRLSLEGNLDAPRYLDYKVGGYGTPKVHLTTPIILGHCVIRSSNPNDPVTYITVEFKVDGSNKVKLDMTEVPLRVSQQMFRPDNGRQWYLMVMLGGELDSNTGRVSFDSSATPLKRASYGDQVGLDIPYASQWITLELQRQDNGNYSAGGMEKLIFRPLGVLFKIQARNDLPYTHIQAYGYKIRSRICDSKGYFDLNSHVGTLPRWSFAEKMPVEGWERHYALEEPTMDMPAKKEDDAFHYLWMMPSGVAESGPEAFAITSVTVRDRVSERLKRLNGNKDSQVLLTTLEAKITPPSKTLRNGTSLMVHPRIQPGWNPLELMGRVNYVGDYPNVKQTRSLSNDLKQLFNYEEARQIALQHPGWKLPTRVDWVTIVGEGTKLTRSEATDPVKKTEFVVEKSTEREIHSHYKPIKKFTLCYAVRFQATSDSRSYSAWRYSIQRNPDSKGDVCVIKSCYLGPGAHEDLESISNELWWDLQGNKTIRYLPMAGRWAPHKTDRSHPFGKGVEAYYWTNTRGGYKDHRLIWGQDDFWHSAAGFGAPTNYACVRLFRDF
jgi:lipoprotein